MNEQELKDRTMRFALRVIKLASALPTNAVGRTVGTQLLRSGTSVGANYRAACRARSRAEFVAKLGIVVEEADESLYWLEIIMKAGLMTQTRIEPLWKEANELVAIMAASRKSAREPDPAFHPKSSIENRKSQER